MPLVLFVLVTAGAAKLWADADAKHQRHLARAAAYRHPALQPVTIYTPEFYAALTKQHNRPFLGK